MVLASLETMKIQRMTTFTGACEMRSDGVESKWQTDKQQLAVRVHGHDSVRGYSTRFCETLASSVGVREKTTWIVDFNDV